MKLNSKIMRVGWLFSCCTAFSGDADYKLRFPTTVSVYWLYRLAVSETEIWPSVPVNSYVFLNSKFDWLYLCICRFFCLGFWSNLPVTLPAPQSKFLLAANYAFVLWSFIWFHDQSQPAQPRNTWWSTVRRVFGQHCALLVKGDRLEYQRNLSILMS